MSGYKVLFGAAAMAAVTGGARAENVGWTSIVGSSDWEEINAIHFDKKKQMLYAAGKTSEALNGQAYSGGDTDSAILKYDKSGKLLMTILQGSAANDFASGIVSDSTGSSFYVVGSTYGALPGQTNKGI